MRNILILLVICALSAGCKHADDDITYKIRGRILQDCSGTPVTSYPVRLVRIGGGGIGAPTTDLGDATTDANGHFEISGIPAKYQSELSLYHDNPGGGVTNWLIDFYGPGTNKDYDLGTFYFSSQINSIAKLTINTSSFTSGDSLYVGRSNNDYEVLYPVPPLKILELNTTTSVPSRPEPPANGYSIAWSKHKSHFDSLTGYAYNRPLDYERHIFHTKTAVCVSPDTTYVTLP